MTAFVVTMVILHAIAALGSLVLLGERELTQRPPRTRGTVAITLAIELAVAGWGSWLVFA